MRCLDCGSQAVTEATGAHRPGLPPVPLPRMWQAVFAHPRWPQTPVAVPDPTAPRPKATALILGYGLSGAGMVPHMVYFVDLAVRGRGLDPRLRAHMAAVRPWRDVGDTDRWSCR